MEVLERVGRLEERADATEKRLDTVEQTHSRAFERVDKKLDKLIFWMLAASVGTLGTIIVGLLFLPIKR